MIKRVLKLLYFRNIRAYFVVMQFLIVCAILIAVVVAIPAPLPDSQNSTMENMTLIYYEDENGNIQFENLFSPEVGDINVAEEDVNYHFYSRKNPVTGLPILPSDLSVLNNSAFNSAKDTLFIVHGWKSSHKSEVNLHIKEKVLKTHDVNVFVVDWSPKAAKDYLSARLSVGKVGELVADFIRSLNTEYLLQLGNVKIVGYSLGAHVSGNAGEALNGQVDVIVGLDPAGPFFSSSSTDRLDPTDAKFVQVIHTKAGMLGANFEMGHSDYYPNGGRRQPGCEIDLGGVCSHARAYEYYAESLTTKKFVATQCTDWTEYKAGKCANGTVSSMGMFNVDTRARGKYYLSTRSSPPFAEGK